MSCVIGTVFKNFAIISGDTRLSKDSGETISDTFSKVFKINQNVLVGFTGSGGAVDVLNQNGIFDKDDCPSAEDYLEFLWLLLGNRVVNEPNHCNILVFGKSKMNYGFGGNFHMSDDDVQNQLHLTDHRNVWSPIMTPPNVDYEYYQDLVNSKVQFIIAEQIISPVFSRGMAIKKIKEIHREIILEISKKDKSVNSNIEQYVIKW